jgi:NADPH2:quinone reductase
MIAAVCHAYGPPESLHIEDFPEPRMGPGDVRVAVDAASVNFPDNLIIEGKYQVKPELPFVPGFEVAGTVIEVGSSVARFRAGDRVMALVKNGHGGFAEQAVAEEVAVDPIPAGMDPVTATAFYSAYGTSCHALVQRGRLTAGETLLVLGAAGGVGLASIEIGKALGARVIAAAGGSAKVEAARRHGADDVIDYRTEDLRERILALTGGAGVDVCLDGVGGDVFDTVSRSMARNGRLLVVGFASGRIPRVPTNLLLLKEYEVVGVYWNNFVAAEPEGRRRNSRLLAALHASGQLRPDVLRTFELRDLPRALRAVQDRGVIGKLVVTVRA